MSFFKRLFGKQTGGHESDASSPSPDVGRPVGSGTTSAVRPEDPVRPGISENRGIRIFISSTFKDMMEERDALMTHAWPELRRFCHERQVELVEVDLRWGISEEQSTRKETLKLCLDEIRSCRPFFIGLLGERYGWVPGEDAFTKDLEEEQPWLTGLKDKSVTELEILHGVLNTPEMAGRSFFYFRDPAYTHARGPDFLSESDDDAKKQAALKQVIRAVSAAKNIPLRDNYPSPAALVSLVLEDLKPAIDNQFPISSIPDPLDRERRDHEAFAETRRRTYIGRPDYFEALDRHALSDGIPLVLLGESGSGKSALLANWVARWGDHHPGDFIFQHYIGGTPDSADHWRLISRLMAEIRRWSNDPEALPASRDEIRRDFPLWLAKGRLKAEGEGVRFIIVLDGLNQLEDQDRAGLLGWLPEDPFRGPLRLIVSTLPGEAMDAVMERGWDSLRVEPLTSDERRRMIAGYLGYFGKKLDAPRLDRLASTGAAANPFFLKILLDELRVTGTYEGLDERLNDYLSSPDIPALLQKVLARYCRDYEHDRPGLVRDALGLIQAARRGLAEAELLSLLRPETLPQLPPAVWMPLRAALEESLVDRGGILNFAHDFLRTAVETAFVSDRDAQDEFRLQLADEFEVQPISARTCDELPWLLWQTESLVRLRACLLNIDRFLEIFDRDKEELMSYWVRLGEERTMGTPYLDAFNAWADMPGRDMEEVSPTANALGIFLGAAALYDGAERLFRRALAIHENALGPDHPGTATSLNNLAEILESKGDYDGAEPLLRKALAIDENALGPDQPGTAESLNSLAALLQTTGDYDGAEPLYRRALAIWEKALGPNHPNTAQSLNNLAALLQTRGDYDGAEPLYRRALAICEKTLGPDHPNTATSLNNLAQILRSTGDYDGAEALYRRAVATHENALGPDHPDTATALNDLANLLYSTGDYNGAEPLYRRALAIREKTLGPDHPDTARSLNDLSILLQAKGDYNAAEPLTREGVFRPEASTETVVKSRISRNDPCPCGSGKKYKKCCGRSSLP
jgi:tetratricopeptide (TPR) repeat protein